MKPFGEPSEADIARAVVTELQRQGYETYEEVSTGYASKRADIVATRGTIIAVVEVKAALSMRLLDQLTTWLGGAHYIIGAVGRGHVGVAIERYLRHEGIGLWHVRAGEIFEQTAPRLHRQASVSSLRKMLLPEHQSAEYAKAGTQGGYFTPFRGTCKALLAVVNEQPGIELRLALKEIDHHYASAKSAMSSIPALIRMGVIVGIRVEGVSLRLFPVPRATAGDSAR